jgi:Eukaryotic protein of unknown function (DUF953)
MLLAMPFTRCATPVDATAAWQQVHDHAAEAAFLVFGAEDPGTGASWCKDCVVADPVLRAAIARLRPGLRVYECPVPTRDEWKGNAAHPYRTHPGLRIERIPTLVLMGGGREQGRLVETDCRDPARVAAFLGA